MNDDNDIEWTDNLDFNVAGDYVINTEVATAGTSSVPASSWSTDTLTIGSNPSSTFTISSDASTLKFDNDITFTTHEPVDFVDQLPTINKINAMCREYPGLNKAFNNFKLTYKMVHQDWMGKKKANG